MLEILILFFNGEERFSISYKMIQSLNNLFEDLKLINTTSEIKENIDHIVIPKVFANKVVKVETFIDKNILSNRKGIYISIQNF